MSQKALFQLFSTGWKKQDCVEIQQWVYESDKVY